MSDGILSFIPDSRFMIVGVGLMGQHLAEKVGEHLKPQTLILVDIFADITVDGEEVPLVDYAAQLSERHEVEVIAVVADAANEDQIASLFTAHHGIDYLAITGGISPHPMTPPEDLSLAQYEKVIRANTLGPINIVHQGIKAGSFSDRCEVVVVISSACDNGAEGRAANHYEVSKGGLGNWVHKQSWHYATKYGVFINAISPNPVRGPMATGGGDPVRLRRAKAVEDASPGGLTTPTHTTAQILSIMSQSTNLLGQNHMICGGGTLPQAIYGDLPRYVPEEQT